MNVITRDSICWPSVEAAIDARIHELHRDLETAPIDQVSRLQGEIAGLRWLLLIAEPPAEELPEP